MPRPSPWRVRPSIAAFTAVILVSLAFRSFVHGVGADEYSLLTMAQAIRDGSLPYQPYWDVRLPLAYLWAVPSAFLEDAVRSVIVLRWLAWLGLALAAWLFFCLFRRTLGTAAAALGALAVILATNATGLHKMAMPNHFSMALAVLAFACLVAGRRGRPTAYFASALLAGALPWAMAQAALVALSLGVLAVFRSPQQTWSTRLLWLAVAALPSLAIACTYFFWGPFDVFVRTIVAPLGVLDMRGGTGYRPFSGEDLRHFLSRAPWAPFHMLVVAGGLLWLPRAVRRANAASALRLSPYLVVPLLVGYAALAYVKPPGPPEYVIDLAPALGLAVAVAAWRIATWQRWKGTALALRVRPGVLGVCATLIGAALLALPFDPWEKPRPPLPNNYCKAATYWLQRAPPDSTVLDTTGLCAFQLLDGGARLQPPFTFPPLWLRQLNQPWVGAALTGDGSPEAAAERLQSALAATANTSLILAGGELLRELRQRGWERQFYLDWRLAWFVRVDGIDAGERFDRLAIFVARRDGWGAPGLALADDRDATRPAKLDERRGRLDGQAPTD